MNIERFRKIIQYKLWGKGSILYFEIRTLRRISRFHSSHLLSFISSFHPPRQGPLTISPVMFDSYTRRYCPDVL